MKTLLLNILSALLILSSLPKCSIAESIDSRIENLLDAKLSLAWQDAEVSWEKGAAWRIDGLRETDEFQIACRDFPRGATVVNLTVMRRGQIYRRIPLSIRVSVLKEVPVAVVKLERNETLNIDQITWEKRDISKNSLRYPEKVDAISNGKWCLKRSVQAGQPINWSMLEEKPLVTRGDQIDLIARSGNVTITAPGISLEKAYKEDRILVENAVSGTRLVGVVIGEKSVLVEGVATQIR